MKTMWIALATFLLGLVVGIASMLVFRSASAAAWSDEHEVVNRWFEEVPGFTEHKDALQPLIENVQRRAADEMWLPPRTDSQRETYRSVVVLFVAGEYLDQLDPGPATVVERALKRVGLNSYWIDPDPRYRDDADMEPQQRGDGG